MPASRMYATTFESIPVERDYDVDTIDVGLAVYQLVVPRWGTAEKTPGGTRAKLETFITMFDGIDDLVFTHRNGEPYHRLSPGDIIRPDDIDPRILVTSSLRDFDEAQDMLRRIANPDNFPLITGDEAKAELTGWLPYLILRATSH